MCGRYALNTSTGDIENRFRSTGTLAGMEPHYNIAPGMHIPILLNEPEGRVIRLAKWGLVPHWAKDPAIGYKMINAQSEGISEKPSFRSSFRSSRCLIPATGFFEWSHIGKEKIPYYIHLKHEDLFAFAGLYSVWKDAEDHPMLTCTIITTTPNTLMKPIHDRMPVIFSKQDEDSWLDSTVSDPSALLALLDPYPASDMTAHTVSTGVNNTRNDSADLLDYVKPAPTLFG